MNTNASLQNKPDGHPSASHAQSHAFSLAAIRGALLDWYDQERRALPWRAPHGQRSDPYRVWLSEVMLQQTTVPAVIPYFLKFTQLWPDVHHLAAAPLEEVLKEWAGLGYYARARNLHACAKTIVERHNGEFPQGIDALQALPGIGSYTAGAIAAIAFDQPVAAVDGNAERVMARLFAVTAPMPECKPELKALAQRLADAGTGEDGRAGDYVQSLMDLGSSLCRPANPECGYCPLQRHCKGRESGIASDLPRRSPKKDKPTRQGWLYWITCNQSSQVALERRSEKGLLGGMLGLPTSPWLDSQSNSTCFPEKINKNSVIQENDGPEIRHVFTHFALTLKVRHFEIPPESLPSCYEWHAVEHVETAGLPTLFKKAVRMMRQDRGVARRTG